MFRRMSLASVLVLACVGVAAGQEVQLEFKYPQGRKSVNETEVKVKQTLGIGEMNVDTQVDQFVKSIAEVGKRTAEGTLPVTNRIAALQVDMVLPGGLSMAYDSANTQEQKAPLPQLDPVMDAFRALAGSEWTMTLDKQNRVVSVTNKGEAWEKVEDAYKSQFDPEVRKREANQEIDILPGMPVKPGDTWERSSKTDLGGGQTMDFRTRYKYAGTVTEGGRPLHKITSEVIDVDYAMDPNAASPLKINSSELNVDSSEGVLLFDAQAGRTVDHQVQVRIKGKLTMTFGGMELPGSLDLEMKTKTKLNEKESTAGDVP